MLSFRKSIKGRDVLVHGGYEYWNGKKYVRGNTIWNCTFSRKTKCRARVTTRDGMISKEKCIHNHPAAKIHLRPISERIRVQANLLNPISVKDINRSVTNTTVDPVLDPERIKRPVQAKILNPISVNDIKPFGTTINTNNSKTIDPVISEIREITRVAAELLGRIYCLQDKCTSRLT